MTADILTAFVRRRHTIAEMDLIAEFVRWVRHQLPGRKKGATPRRKKTS